MSDGSRPLARGLASRLDALHAAVIRRLDGVSAFWIERARDVRDGGYLTNFDESRCSLGTPEKYLNTQCRLAWWFSTLARRRPSGPELPALASRGLGVVIDRFWDPQHGGWFWKVAGDGRLLDDGKIVCGQSFALYAVAEHHLASDDARSRDYACRTFEKLQIHCADVLHGGCIEHLAREGTSAGPGFEGGDARASTHTCT